jgi:hypothetical protein
MSAFLKNKIDITLKTPSGIIIKEISNRSRSIMFSDTVLIYTLSNTEDDFYQIFIESQEFFKDCISKCIPLRGAICHGRFDFNPNEMIYMGEALIDAYKLCESLQFMGICVDDYTANVIQNSREVKTKYGRESVLRQRCAIKEKNNVIYAELNMINLWNIYKGNFLKKDFSVEEFYEAFEPNFGPFENLSDDVQFKYENTVQLIMNTYK